MILITLYNYRTTAQGFEYDNIEQRKGVGKMLSPMHYHLTNSIRTFYAAGLFSFSTCLLIIFVFMVIAIIIKMKKLFTRSPKKKQEIVHPISDLLDRSEVLEELDHELIPFGFKYEPYQDIFYSIMNGWQRTCGYCRLYDEATAPLGMIVDSEPITFEYNGYRWLIEFWKGQYGMTTGCEIGIYYTDEEEKNIPGIFQGYFYYSISNDDRMNMSFALRKNGNLLFTRSGYHWWLTGFKLGEFSKPSELTMDIMLDFFDKTMLHAFVEGLKRTGYARQEYEVRGLRVYIHFDKPHSPQPVTRTAFTEFLMQRSNGNLCHTYNHITNDFKDTLDKLVVLRKESPNMYYQVLNLGKTKAVFDAFTKMKEFLRKEPDGKA
jgi:hypothetical protein